MLELALLGLLKERPMHGYDLRKRLREDFGLLANLSFGSLYPALARLEANGAVREVEARLPEEPAFLPLTGSLGGERASLVARRATAKAAAALGGRGTRARKVYEITPRGEQLFEELLESSDASGEDGRTFSLKLAFARHLSPAARLRLLERRRMQLLDRLAKRDDATRRGRPLDHYEHAIAEHAREVTLVDLAWVEAMLEDERQAFAAAGHPGDARPTGAETAPTRSRRNTAATTAGRIGTE